MNHWIWQRTEQTLLVWQSILASVQTKYAATLINLHDGGIRFLVQTGLMIKPVTSADPNPLHHCWQVVCCGPIRSTSTGIAWRRGSTWQKSGLTGLHGSSCFWKRLMECLTRSLSRPYMRGTHIHKQTQASLIYLDLLLSYFFVIICYCYPLIFQGQYYYYHGWN